MVGFGSIVLSLWTRTVEPAALGAPFMMVLLVSVLDGWWRPVTAHAASVSAPRVIEGDELTVSIDLAPGRAGDWTEGDRTAGQRMEVHRREVPWVELELQLPATLHPTGPARFVTSLDKRQRFDVPVRATRWGAAGPEWAVVTTRDRLGVSELVVRYPLQVPVRVHPPAERLNHLVPLYRDRPVTGEHHSRRTGPGSELAEVRPYRFGDPVRSIHPRLTQRRGTPMVIDRHPDRSSDIVLLVDSAQDLGIDLDTTLRWTVTAATALADRHLRAQDRVGLLDVGRGVRWLPARLGRRHLHSVVDALLATEVLLDLTRDDVFVVPSNLPRSAAIVAVSPLLSELVLAALVDLRSRGHEVIVVKPTLPDPDPSISLLARRVFRAGNELNERWLTERGATVIPWSTGDPLDHIMRRVVQNLGRARQRV